MTDLSTSPSGNSVCVTPQPTVVVNNAPDTYQHQKFSETPPQKISSSGKTRCILVITLCMLFVAVIVLVPLIMTGVLSIHKKSDAVKKRSTYDPFYYGNLHPYLYPGEKEDMGIETDYDVIVVGAGIAGLTAANALQQEGLNVLVLEARVSEVNYFWFDN
jgi:hypothetical protein